MVQVLKDLKKDYDVVGVKAEFEAEGTRIEELLRLKEICMKADIALTLKIGGCEAIRDMYDAKNIGVDYLVAPMVETAFALRKYLKAVNQVFSEDERKETEFLINVETQTAVENFGEMLKVPEIDTLDGVVIGRVDLVGSMDLDRSAANSEKIFSMTKKVLSDAKKKGLSCVLGGAISTDSIQFMRDLKGVIDRYETRKVCFSCPKALGANADKGISKAVEFELLWLQNKKSYYKKTYEEDDKRIIMLEERFKKGLKK